MRKKLLTFLISCLIILLSFVTLTACDNDAVYNVTFKVDGVETVVDVVDGGKVTEPTNPTKNGYDFIGWYNGETKWSFDSVVSGNVTLEGKFSAKNYSITYDLAGGSVETANPTTYTIESENITLTNPTKDYYNFLGWDAGDGVANSNVTINKGSVGNKTFTAKYAPISYSITYDLGGGITTNPTTYTVEDTFTLNVPVKNESNFIGWTWEGQTTPILEVTIEAGTYGNKAFVANYAEIYSITYDLAGGNVAIDNPISYSEFSEEFTLNNPTKADCIFVGWTYEGQTEPQLTVTIEKGSTGNKTFTANYETIFTVDTNGVITSVNEKALTYTVLNIPATINGVTVVNVKDSVLSLATNVVEFTTNNPGLKVVDGDLYTADGSILIRYAPAKTNTSFTVPESVIEVRAYAFANAVSLNEVIIPDNVIIAGKNLFEGASNVVVKVEDSDVSATYPNEWANGAKDVIYDYLTGDDDDNIIEI